MKQTNSTINQIANNPPCSLPARDRMEWAALVTKSGCTNLSQAISQWNQFVKRVQRVRNTAFVPAMGW